MSAQAVWVGNPFSASEDRFGKIVADLGEMASMALTHSELERRLHKDGIDLMRVLLQDHLRLRGRDEPRRVRVVGADHRELTHVRATVRPVMSIFGEVEVPRLSYGGRGLSSLRPQDAALNLADDHYSLEVRRRVAEAAASQSIADTVHTIESTTGAHVPHRQSEQLTVRAAKDFDDFYAMRRTNPEPLSNDTGSVLVLSADGKGIPMRREQLREATRRAADKQSQKLSKRRSKGERAHKKRMSTVAAVYTIEPFPRTPEDIVSELRPLRDATESRRPRPENKRVWASIEKTPADVVAEMFRDAISRDPHHDKQWVALVDGNPAQIETIRAAARGHGIEVRLVLDLIHVLGYLWEAAWSFFPEGSVEGQRWVTERLVRILEGHSSNVAAGIRRKATLNKLEGSKRASADRCANYMLNYRDMMQYDICLARGLPIATGVIEGACRYLVKDRMEITGARWTLGGAEAILKLRALRASGHFDAYWVFHEGAEHRRSHASRYEDAAPPNVSPVETTAAARRTLRLVK